jgi:hypothetical protein
VGLVVGVVAPTAYSFFVFGDLASQLLPSSSASFEPVKASREAYKKALEVAEPPASSWEAIQEKAAILSEVQGQKSADCSTVKFPITPFSIHNKQ